MRTVVALYDRFEDAQQAVRALNDEGFVRDNINLIANDESGDYARRLGLNPTGDKTDMAHQDIADGTAAGAGIGAVLGGLGGLLVGLGALAIPGIGPVLAAGPIVATLTGAAAGAVAGGIVGALVDLGIPEEHAQYYAEGVRRGGSLVTVRTQDDRADAARDILNRYDPVDIETRAEEWRSSGWSAFETTPENNMPVTDTDTDRIQTFDADDEMVDRMDDHIREDVFGKERAGRDVSMPVTGGAMGTADLGTSTADWDFYDRTFQTDYQRRYAMTGYDYVYYQPAYRYGYDLANDERYHSYDWNRLEPVARRDWESNHDSAWDDIKDAVHNAWQTVTGH